MANNISNINWLDDKIQSLPKNNWLYKLVCIFLCKKKLSYKEMFLILQRLNNHLGEEEAKRMSMLEIINIYNFNNGT